MPTAGWRNFEKLIQKVFAKNPKAVVHPDAVVIGRSGRKRKLELIVEYPFEIPFADEFKAKAIIKIAVDCKDHKKPIGIKKVEDLLARWTISALQSVSWLPRMDTTKAREPELSS